MTDSSSSDPYPPPPSDPSAAWEVRRATWLSGRRTSSFSSDATSPKPTARDPSFSARLQLLEQMLTINDHANSSDSQLTAAVEEAVAATLGGTVGTGAASSSTDWRSKGKGKEKQEDISLLPEEMEPDGGGVIGERRFATRSRSRSGDHVQTLSSAPISRPATTSTPPPQPLANQTTSKEDLEKAIEGILAAFKQGRALKEPIPLSLVTKLLYRQWVLDGTIPRDYVPTPSTPPQEEASCVPTPLGTPPLSIDKDKDKDKEAGPGATKLKMGELSGGKGWREEKEVESGSDPI